MKKWYLSLFVVTAIASAVLAISKYDSSGAGPSKSSGHKSIAAPVSLLGVVESADVIVHGTVLSVTDGGLRSFGLVPPAGANSTPFTFNGVSPTLDRKITLIGIRVDEVLFARSPITLKVSTVITIARSIDLSSYVTPTPATLPLEAEFEETFWYADGTVLNSVDDERLFFLKQMIAPAVAGLYGLSGGVYNILDISGSEVMVASSPPVPIDISEDAETAAFLQELAALIQQQ